jgi:hypothetical protein
MEDHLMTTTDRLESERLIEALKARGPALPVGSMRAAARRGRGRPQPLDDKDVEAANAHVRIGMDARVQSAGVLANPVVTRQVLLDKPILIWQYPHPTPIFIDSHIEPMNSAARILVKTNSGSLNTWFTFHYLWANDSPAPVVVDVETPVILTGDCFAQARAGIFSGYETTISLSATLAIMRNTGWGNDPLTGDHQYVPVLQHAQKTSISSLNAEGGGLFGGAGTDSEPFAAAAYSLSYRSLLVPAGATVIFEPTFYLYCSLEGDTIEDIVDIDFSNRGRAVRCPYVALSIQSHE